MTHEQFNKTVYNVGAALSAGLWGSVSIKLISELDMSDIGKAILFSISIILSTLSSWVGVGFFIGVALLGAAA